MIHTKLIVDKVWRENSSIAEQCSGYTVCSSVTITMVSRAMEQKTMSMVAILYIAGKASTEYGVEQVHDSVVGVSRCRPRVSASRSGGETTAASHSEDSLD